MQNKGAIKTFAILLALVCLFQLSFTFFSKKVERNARSYASSEQVVNLATQYAKGDVLREGYYYDSISKARERYYLDSMSTEVVYNILLKKYTYQDCKERELNLGLDLKGGMNVMLEVSVVDIMRALSANSQDPTFQEAIRMTLEKQKESQHDFITLFAESFEEIDPNARLAAIYAFEFKNKGINTNSSNQEVIRVIRDETEGAIDRSYQIIRTRIDRFGVAQPNIQRLGSQGRILVELPGIKDPERVRKLLQGTANLEFWETYSFNELAGFFNDVNIRLRDIAASFEEESTIEEGGTGILEESETDAVTDEEAGILEGLIQEDTELAAGQDTTETTSLEELLASDTTETDLAQDELTRQEWEKENPLYSVLSPAYYQQDGQMYASEGAAVGYAMIKDTAEINRMLRQVKEILPRDLRLAWTAKAERWQENDILTLYALRITTRDATAPLSGDVIVNASQDYDQNGQVEVSMSMNSEGARIWKRMTGENIGRQIAIVLDDYVRSAPNVTNEIPNGQSSISGGGMTVEEAQDMANILKAGKLPARARIVQEEVVGPSLGKEAIQSGLNSFILAFCLVIVYMIFYYNRAGFVADIALISNMFFLFGVLASLGATLTLPGIAGIVLTLGMAVDANVIIYERIKEEVRQGKGVRLAISDGYKNAYSAIIDGNVTTLLTGIVLYIFGSGPVQGFATTLIIGIISSLFSAIFISRLIFSWMLDKNKKIAFGNKFTINAFTGLTIDFIGLRKKFYIVSAVLVVIGVASLLTRGLSEGVDFSGGRTYVVRFDQDIRTDEVRTALEVEFDDAPEVKTFGPSKQVKITTKYMIDNDSEEVDSIIDAKLYTGLNGFYLEEIDYETFVTDSEDKLIGKLSSQKVGPTIADDIKRRSVWAILIALVVIFIYVASRFKRWQFGVGGVITLIHDSLIAVSMYSLFYGIVPFNLEVDQSFIAAILTIIGYSINDSVIIFDRIREYTNLYPKRNLKENINGAVNSTLGRTFMTSGTTLLVLLIIFIFGGEIIRGFSFALIVGVIVGTYSSVFISTPIAYDLTTAKGGSKLIPKKKK